MASASSSSFLVLQLQLYGGDRQAALVMTPPGSRLVTAAPHGPGEDPGVLARRGLPNGPEHRSNFGNGAGQLLDG